MSAPIIFLFRHGETEWNSEGRRQGKMNSNLTPRGRLQARNNARLLQNYSSLDEPFMVYVSPLGRAKETAQIMLNEIGISEEKINYDDRLMESSFGKWEGLTDAEIAQTYPSSWQARKLDRWNTRPPSGESYADVSSRVSEWLNEVEFSNTTLVICHGLTSRVLRGIYLELTHQEIFDLTEPQDGFFKLSKGKASYIV
ncbi:MAG: histidine phosphatase family protein [Flavobacteriaceae bacterium]|jgi:broad specificity phosphatase PhoE